MCYAKPSLTCKGRWPSLPQICTISKTALSMPGIDLKTGKAPPKTVSTNSPGPSSLGPLQGLLIITPVVQFDGVHMAYGAGPNVLSNISFDLAQGDFRFLTGPSGAGKTSLLKMLYLSQKPSEGRIKMFGRNLSETRGKIFLSSGGVLALCFKSFGSSII